MTTEMEKYLLKRIAKKRLEKLSDFDIVEQLQALDSAKGIKMLLERIKTEKN